MLSLAGSEPDDHMKCSLLRLFAASLLAGLFVTTGAAAQTAVTQIFLIQNSGWMLPFYEDPSANFKKVVRELSSRVAPYGAEQAVVSFNQSIGENQSPRLHYRGSDPAKIGAAIDAIQVVHKPGKQTYTDTDFKEAIVGAISQLSPGTSCLIWIITNNKNSPNNSAETIEKNKEFYRFLQESKDIKRIVAFPHLMPARSKSLPAYQASGLMYYGMAYGEPADRVLQRMLAANAPFGNQPARLKPLDAEALTFIPQGVKNKNVDVRLASDHKTLVLTFAADSKPEVAELIGQFRNDFFPYDIRSANLDITPVGFATQDAGPITLSLSTRSVSNIPAGGLSQDIGVAIKVPSIPSLWDPKVIFGSGYRTSGVIQFALQDQQLALSKDFAKSMSDLFPKDPLPDLFIPGDAARKSVTAQELLINVTYPIWPLVVVATLGLLILGGGGGALILARQEKVYKVSVDGQQKSIALRPYGQAMLKNAAGEKIGVLKRGFGRPVPILDKGRTASVRVL